jgi:superfamily II DNA or RNA helicase
MPTSERENILDEFQTASKALISNAGCLTEGVDVTSVDMVAFLTPKRSRKGGKRRGRVYTKDKKTSILLSDQTIGNFRHDERRLSHVRDRK